MPELMIMKASIQESIEENIFYVSVGTASDPLRYDFVCGSLGECLEQIIQARIQMNDQSFGQLANPEAMWEDVNPTLSLKDQALAILDDCSRNLDGTHENILRRALEALPND